MLTPFFHKTRIVFLLHFIAHVFLYLLLLVRPVQAEIWLSDTLYIENQQHLQLSVLKNRPLKDSPRNDDSLGLRLLPEFSLVQIFPTSLFASKITLGSKLDLQVENANTIKNNQTKMHSQAIINELNITTALRSNWTVTLGRQKIAHQQQGLFNTSLNKNDRRPVPLEDLTFSQGLLTKLRFGAVEQSLYFNQKSEGQKVEQKQSLHYQLKVGIPGYKIGPLVLLFSREKKAQDIINRAMIGSALQFPLRIARGDWQWAFQYARELNNDTEKNQAAWQTSLSWLGFIPNHKLGILYSHTDSQWTYSDDFSAEIDRTELRYQWYIQQRSSVEVAASTRTNSRINDNEIKLHVNVEF